MTSSTHSFLYFITDIGDSACLTALVAAASIYLITRKSGRAATFLATSLLCSAGIITLLKIFFLGCHSHFHAFSIHSPSGHAATSAAVFWAVAILMRSQLEAPRRFLPMLVFTLLNGAIAVSRVWLEFHSAAEVCLGLLAGYLGLMVARFLVLRGKSLAPFDAYALVLWIVVAVFLAHGYHLPAEDFIHDVASHLHGKVPFCGRMT